MPTPSSTPRPRARTGTALITFGAELEAAAISSDCATLVRNRNFREFSDASIRAASDHDRALELITPVLSARVTLPSAEHSGELPVDFGSTQSVIEDLCACAARVNDSCGYHVHLGRPNEENTRSYWNDDQIRCWLGLGLILESKLFDLCPPSRRDNRYCRRISEIFTAQEIASANVLGRLDPDKYNNTKRRCWLNMVETRREGSISTPGRRLSQGTGTIEIRMLGCVRRANYIWAWTKMWVQIAAYVAYQPSTVVLNTAINGGLDRLLNEVAVAKAASTAAPANATAAAAAV